VTGSVGKTTVKEILKSIFTCSAAKGETSRLGEDTSDDPDGPRVVTTFGNYNNSVGLPLTLLSMGPKTRLVAAELGANHLGEIEALTKICEPDVGLVTALGAAHMEYFGSLERVAQAKGELYLGLKEDAVAAINIHEPELVKIAQKFLGRKVFFGFKASGADLEVEKVKDMGVMGQRLCFSGPMVGKSPLTLDLSLAGDHNALNAAAAAIVARILGISWVDIASGLTETSAAPGRLKISKSPQGIWVIDDSYNANPTSMTAALDFLAGLEGPRAAILGDMLELGDNSQKWHKEIGQKASTANLTRLAVVGKLAKTIGEAAIEAGFVEEKVGFFEDPQKAAQWLIQGLSQEMQPELSVLIKGSRVIGLERAVSVFFTNTQPAVDTGVQRNG
jgi:UDP-N-acetylmuramoyl-tripeptide--D-alanyl-D-alanine ligase